MSLFTMGSRIKVYLATETVDMRKSFNGLIEIVNQTLLKNALSGHLFVFRGKRSDRVKLLYWDRTGFCIWYKRLEKGQFLFPRIEGQCAVIGMHELSLLLEGVDLTTKRLSSYSLNQDDSHESG